MSLKLWFCAHFPENCEHKCYNAQEAENDDPNDLENICDDHENRA
jgi:hypothetical protein